VKLFALALDYDGTTASRDAMSADVREAIAEARAKGITVLLATGRILDDLRRVAGDLRFVDGIVAENGAVLHVPETGHTTILAPLVPASFVEELRRRGIPHGVGHCLVDASANDAGALLQAIRTLELPLVLIFNAGRVMALPQAVSKATGLQAMLTALRCSPHNMLAIGDAENDHELVRLAEVGAAVEWGSPTLRAAADTVVPGSGPPAVAAYIRALAVDSHLPVPARARRRLILGHTEEGREFSLAVRGRNVLIAGDAKSGKSWAAGLLCEQLILRGYCVCVIDPEGDYRTLEALPGVDVLGGERTLPSSSELLRALKYPDRSIVIDLSHQRQDEKIGYIRSVLPLLNQLRRQTGLPHRIVVDEAHYFLHDANAHHLLDLDAGGYTLVTYWASRLPQELLRATEVMIVTRESNPREIEALRKWCSTCAHVDPARWNVLGRLTTAQAVALPITEESGGNLVQFTLGPRLTPHVRHRAKYVDVPVFEPWAFVFTPNGHQGYRRVRTLRHFVAELERGTEWDTYLRRGDFSRWIADVFGDHVLAAELREAEAAHRVAPSPQTMPTIIKAIRARYELDDRRQSA
jgi:hydroxymethylpyrimidine pyrophosphatase-like HAD family hydrolase